ncbi:MAG: hypothetical protein WC477_02765 [Patescibacteria group bacterium]
MSVKNTVQQNTSANPFLIIAAGALLATLLVVSASDYRMRTDYRTLTQRYVDLQHRQQFAAPNCPAQPIGQANSPSDNTVASNTNVQE